MGYRLGHEEESKTCISRSCWDGMTWTLAIPLISSTRLFKVWFATGKEILFCTFCKNSESGAWKEPRAIKGGQKGTFSMVRVGMYWNDLRVWFVWCGTRLCGDIAVRGGSEQHRKEAYSDAVAWNPAPPSAAHLAHQRASQTDASLRALSGSRRPET